jgi:hypothetical protein
MLLALTLASALAGETPAATVTGSPGKGVTFTLSDTWSLNIRTRFQLRYTLKALPGDETTYDQLVNIGTARLWLSGNALTPDTTYLIQLAVAGRDYRDGATSPIFDAYVDHAITDDVHVRAGQFFVPFDRLRTVREFALQMADRPRPVGELTLDRDVGVDLYSKGAPLGWHLGAFGGGGTNLSAGREPGGLFVGRVELRPLGEVDDDSEGDLEKLDAPGLAVGGAFAANVNTNRQRSTTGTTFTGGTATYLHAAGDVVFKWRGFALQGEYLWKDATDDTIVSTDDAGAEIVEYTRSGTGWVAQASYFFDPIEVVGRASQLRASEGTDPKLVSELDAKGNELGAGVNWYLNGHRAKLQADWIALLPPSYAFDEAEHTVHAQLDVTF